MTTTHPAHVMKKSGSATNTATTDDDVTSPLSIVSVVTCITRHSCSNQSNSPGTQTNNHMDSYAARRLRELWKTPPIDDNDQDNLNNDNPDNDDYVNFDGNDNEDDDDIDGGGNAECAPAVTKRCMLREGTVYIIMVMMPF